jgi:hypothetical protein
MRFVVERWYVVPILSMVALFVCCLIALSGFSTRTKTVMRRDLSRIYALAAIGNFDQLRQSGLLTEESVEYLREQDRCFGPIKVWNLNRADDDVFESDSQGQVGVVRPGLRSTDRVGGGRSNVLSLSPDYPLNFSEEFANRTTPLRTPEEAKKVARAILKSSQQDFPIKTFDVKRAGEYWLATVSVSKQGGFATRYLIMSGTGKPLSYFEPSQSSVGD